MGVGEWEFWPIAIFGEVRSREGAAETHSRKREEIALRALSRSDHKEKHRNERQQEKQLGGEDDEGEVCMAMMTLSQTSSL